jgi:CheY-specific phosphatase CheX
MDILSETIRTAIRTSISQTFETLSFSEITEWEILDRLPDTLDHPIGSSIGIRQPVKGTVEIILGLSHCSELIEAVHGPEAAGTEGMLADFMNELANTIAGRLASTLTEHGGKIRIELPVPVDESTAPASRHSSKKELVLRFMVDDKPGFCIIGKTRSA